MIGISSSGKEQISSIVESMFDSLALQLIGNIPKLQNKKTLVISSKSNYGLSNLFVQSMQNKNPNSIEQDVLKSLLNSAHGYVESLKNRTASNVTERVDGLIKESKMSGQKIEESKVQEIIAEELEKAKNHMKTIAEAESTKLRNLGTMMDITKVSSALSDQDPTVFFSMVKDNSTCKECLRLHMMPDQVTPRLWKLSELSHSYHKRGNDKPSLFGLHPGCRCGITYLSKGYSFNKEGKLKYQSENFDAFEDQKE